MVFIILYIPSPNMGQNIRTKEKTKTKTKPECIWPNSATVF